MIWVGDDSGDENHEDDAYQDENFGDGMWRPGIVFVCLFVCVCVCVCVCERERDRERGGGRGRGRGRGREREGGREGGSYFVLL